jgi:hypothetical protein
MAFNLTPVLFRSKDPSNTLVYMGYPCDKNGHIGKDVTHITIVGAKKPEHESITHYNEENLKVVSIRSLHDVAYRCDISGNKVASIIADDSLSQRISLILLAQSSHSANERHFIYAHVRHMDQIENIVRQEALNEQQFPENLRHRSNTYHLTQQQTDGSPPAQLVSQGHTAQERAANHITPVNITKDPDGRTHISPVESLTGAGRNFENDVITITTQDLAYPFPVLNAG